MDANELIYAKGVLIRLAQAARGDFALTQQARELILQSGILDLFGSGADLNLFDLLDAGGAELLRSRLAQLTLPQLKQIIVSRGYDPDKTSARWRSPARFVDLIANKATDQWQQLTLTRIATAPTQRIAPGEPALPNNTLQPNDPAAAAAWML